MGRPRPDSQRKHPQMTEMFPTWLHKLLDSDILSQKNRYTTKHTTHNHVAILFQGRKIIAIGQNRISGYRRTGTVHAEADAIHSLGDTSKLRGATMVIIRIGPSSLLNSKPCPSCQCLLEKCKRTYGLRSWIYS